MNLTIPKPEYALLPTNPGLIKRTADNIEYNWNCWMHIPSHDSHTKHPFSKSRVLAAAAALNYNNDEDQEIISSFPVDELFEEVAKLLPENFLFKQDPDTPDVIWLTYNGTV